jgi:hypothetical protein
VLQAREVGGVGSSDNNKVTPRCRPFALIRDFSLEVLMAQFQ